VTQVFAGTGPALAYDVTEGGADGEGPTVLLLHGLSAARTSWDAVRSHVAASLGARVFAIDHRGHGESARTPGHYGVDDYAADAAAFVEQVVGGPVAVVGHSLGGLVAAHLAAERPELVSAAYLEDPPLYLGNRDTFNSTIFGVVFPIAQQFLADLHARDGTIDDVVEVIGALPSIRGEGTMLDQLGPAGVRQQATTWFRFDPGAFGPAIDGSLFHPFDPTAPIRCAVRLLRAERELGAAFLPEHEALFRAAQPHAEVELVDGASHLIHEERPDWFVQDLGSFLAPHF
jgi:pimeloyl-ACP methyl ester carboxylesterase